MNFAVEHPNPGEPDRDAEARHWLGRSLAWEARLDQLRAAYRATPTITPRVRPSTIPERRVA
jgi:hypothetical protein